MQEPQQTPTSNAYFDLVSVLYHSLETAQTSASYVRDAQQEGNQDLVSFFKQIQQDASSKAEKAKQLMNQIKS